ncbi:dienelactone hydrolase family protein [Salinibacterium sp. G-O1]|uniref:alpha/beta hydrolase n=1 Tax=Salinibacterium sp. G-O1 TaxID=3046208 RepID=UPI0024BA8C12|nr:dienelactone hydrolase family protein [Salinibacterium sp. G-O1]MDJ0334084.1 dienelactone hydrolase family protein [Salinibacterium sp. G-O1]
MKLDESAILWSAPERERAGRPLLVLMHGYGSHEGDLFAMSPALPLEPVIAAVRAPIAESGGWAWWSRQDSPAGEPPMDKVDAAAAAVIDWLDTIDSGAVSLLGFSQGGALALQLLRHDAERFAATVSLSGFIASGEHAGDARLAEVKPAVFWGRGTDDAVIPSQAIDRTAAWIPQHTTATIRSYEGIGHSISTPELAEFSGFLRSHG